MVAQLLSDIHLWKCIVNNAYQQTKTGRHCCILCEIRQDQLKVPKEDRPPIPERTLATLLKDHSIFMKHGGNIKNAKHYNNAILPPFFDIPLEQVHIPISSVLLLNRKVSVFNYSCR